MKLANTAVAAAAALALMIGAAPASAEVLGKAQSGETIPGSTAVQARSTPSGFKPVKEKKQSAILGKMIWRYEPASTRAACWDIYLAKSSKRWGTMRLANVSGCPSGEGLVAIAKSGKEWTELPIAGSSLPCYYLTDQLRSYGAPKSVVRNFKSGWRCF